MALNSSMNIQVRIAARNAMAQLARLEAELKAVNAQNMRTTTTSAAMAGGLSAGLIKAGSTTQWAGRQLTYNFAIPIALAAGAATKFALDNEKAMTRVRKVYGDNSPVFNRLTKTEVPALQKAFRALSDEFGVNQAEVDNVAADWAAAGATGLALAKSTKLTMETMVLGELNATEATRSLIAIQAQYGMTVDKNKKGTDNLTDTINLLNMVENQTGTSMNDLIQSISRSAGSARSAGIDVRHLAAMTAALVPAAGTAATAGNSLKTIFSRILAPTRQAADAMEAMGINTKSAAWESANGTRRLQILSEGYMKLSGAQKIQASTAIAGRYQLNRFDILLRDISNANGYYQKSLRATSSAQGNATQAQKELNTVLRSQPQQFKQIGVMLQNMAAEIIGPLIPLFIAFASTIRDLVERFTEMDPRVQKFILTALALLAVFGPILRYVGATTLLVGYLGKAVWGAGQLMFKSAKFIASPFVGLARLAWTAASGVFSALSSVILFLLGPWVSGARTGFGAMARLAASGMGAVVAAVSLPLRVIGLQLVGAFATFAQSILLQLVTLSAGGASVMRALGAAMLEPIAAAARAMVVVTYEMAVRVGDMFALMTARAATALAPLGLALFAPFGAALNFMIRYSGLAFVTLGNLAARGMTAVQIVFARSGSLIVGIVEATGFLMQRAWALALVAYNAITIGLGRVIEVTWAALSSALVAITTGLRTALTTVWASTVLFFNTALTRIGPVLIRGFALIGTALTVVWEAVQTALRTAWAITWAFMQSAAFIGPVLDMLAAAGAAMVAALMSPWGIAIAAVVILLIAFRKKLAGIWHAITKDIGNFLAPFANVWNNIVEGAIRAFDALPDGVQRAIMAVVKIVASAARQIYQWFSYLNPFAHHSPSLVENVNAGMNVVRNQHEQTNKSAKTHSQTLATHHQRMVNTMTTANNSADTMAKSVNSGVGTSRGADPQTSVTNKSVSDLDATLKKFQGDVAQFRRSARSLIPGQWASEIADVRKGLPSLLPSFMKLIGEYRQLNQQAKTQKALVDTQAQTVSQWKQRLDSANKSLDAQQKLLDSSNDNLSKLKDQYSSAQDSMSDFAQSPIKGMQAFNDKIFENSEAQKKIQLQMDMWTQQNGSLDDLNSRFASLNGEIENLQGTADNLRKQGAGSDVLGPINDQIKALQDQAQAAQSAIADSPVDNLQKQMDKLQLAGQILQNQNDIKFDPLQHQIEKLSNTTKELSYKQIIDGITAARTKMNALTPEIQKQTGVIAAQQRVVDESTKARDRISARYDNEKHKLDVLTKSYDRITAAMGRMKDAMSSIDSAASDKISAASAKASKAAGGIDGNRGQFANVGGTAKIGREGGLGDQSDEIAKFTQEQQGKIGKMIGGLDMFGPFKDMWNKFSGWISKHIGPIWGQIENAVTLAAKGIGNALSGLAHSTGAKNVGGVFARIGKFITGFLKGVMNVLKLFWPDLRNLVDGLVQAAQVVWKELGPALGNLFKSFANLWPVLKPVVEIIGLAFLLALKLLASIVVHVVVPALIAIIKITADLINVFADITNFIADVLRGHWIKAFKDIGKIVVDTFLLIWHTISGVVKIVWGLVKGMVGGVVGFFKWLYDVLVGHSIIPDLMKEILGWFEWLIKPAKLAFQLLWTGIKTIWNRIVKPLFVLIKNTIQSVPKWISGIVRNARQFFSNLWNGLKAVWQRWGKPLFDSAKKVVTAIPNWISDKIRNAKQAFGNLWNGLKAIWQRWGKPFFDTIKSVIASIVDKMKAVAKPFANAFSHVLNGLKSIFRTFRTAFSTMWDTLKTIFKAPVKFLVDVVINKGIVGAWNWVAGHLHLPLKLSPVKLQNFREGGSIVGRGSGTSDSILARVSNGEHVWTAKEVKAAGGHGEVERMRKEALSGSQAYAKGGRITDDQLKAIKAQPGAAKRRSLAKATALAAGSDVLPRFKTGGSPDEVIAQVKQFIWSMDPKPYRWDEAGPNGYDCSGAVSAVYNLLKGQNPYRHTFSTFNESSYFRSGPGMFTAGWFNNGNEGHTAGMFDGLKFEAESPATGILVGAKASSPFESQFDHVGHMPLADQIAKLANIDISKLVSNMGFTGGVSINPLHWIDSLKSKITGPIDDMKKRFGNSPIMQMVEGVPSALMTEIIKKAKDAALKLLSVGDGRLGLSRGAQHGDAVANQQYAQSLFGSYGWSDSEMKYLLQLWNQESGWSQFADTRKSGLDPANASTYAYGIAQARPASKYPKAGRPADLGGVSDPRVQIKWGLNYIKGRYGDPYGAWQHELANNWYRNGTQYSKDGWAVVGEAGRELVNLPGGSRVFRNSDTNNMIAKAVREASIQANTEMASQPRYEGKLQTAQVTNNNHTENNFYFDKIEMPNIKSAGDAELFIKNLKTFADGTL